MTKPLPTRSRSSLDWIADANFSFPTEHSPALREDVPQRKGHFLHHIEPRPRGIAGPTSSRNRLKPLKSAAPTELPGLTKPHIVQTSTVKKSVAARLAVVFDQQR